MRTALGNASFVRFEPRQKTEYCVLAQARLLKKKTELQMTNYHLVSKAGVRLRLTPRAAVGNHPRIPVSGQGRVPRE